jgi:hypothetical protein
MKSARDVMIATLDKIGGQISWTSEEIADRLLAALGNNGELMVAAGYGTTGCMVCGWVYDANRPEPCYCVSPRAAATRDALQNLRKRLEEAEAKIAALQSTPTPDSSS